MILRYFHIILAVPIIVEFVGISVVLRDCKLEPYWSQVPLASSANNIIKCRNIRNISIGQISIQYSQYSTAVLQSAKQYNRTQYNTVQYSAVKYCEHDISTIECK